ncbi:unnamed protein product [Auanema sp. JU1783]|nr:unnamed protein product [Auanema sp. JU1783]
MHTLPFKTLHSHANLALLPLSTSDYDMKASFGKQENEYSRIVSKSSNRLLNELWEKKKIPAEGWSEHQLELFLAWLACHDSNNRVDTTPIGAGEREGRVSCPFVQRLHCNMSHGIGRSGNLCEIQPKALGSSMMACLANEFALHALHELGLHSVKSAMVVPLCTGMSLSLCMGSWRSLRPEAKYVVWLRIDQKSCFKSIIHAGFKPIIVEPKREEDALVTDVEAVNTILERRSKEILCVMSTMSCFAPRSPDSVEAIAAICQLYNVPHLVNNAYGLQSEECRRRINSAKSSGRIDAIVQSLDKNFQVPVGGAIIAVCKKNSLNNIAEFYPGRASAVPSRDFVLTMLHQGIKGLMNTFETQQQLFHKMKRELRSFAELIGECVYEVDDNQISLAMTLSSISAEDQTLFGSVLFSRGITGARVVASTTTASAIAGEEFLNFGSHTSELHGGYLNIACGVGMSDDELDNLFAKLRNTYFKFLKQRRYTSPVTSLDNNICDTAYGFL